MFLLRIIGSYFGEFLLYLLCKLKIKAILTLLRLINRKKTIYLKLRLRWKFSVIKSSGRSVSRRLKNSGLRRRLRYSVIQCYRDLHSFKRPPWFRSADTVIWIELTCIHQCQNIFSQALISHCLCGSMHFLVYCKSLLQLPQLWGQELVLV